MFHPLPNLSYKKTTSYNVSDKFIVSCNEEGVTINYGDSRLHLTKQESQILFDILNLELKVTPEIVYRNPLSNVPDSTYSVPKEYVEITCKD